MTALLHNLIDGEVALLFRGLLPCQKCCSTIFWCVALLRFCSCLFCRCLVQQDVARAHLTAVCF
jgi:hypothetical protein